MFWEVQQFISHQKMTHCHCIQYSTNHFYVVQAACSTSECSTSFASKENRLLNGVQVRPATAQAVGFNAPQQFVDV
jgi:hypothetical protein